MPWLPSALARASGWLTLTRLNTRWAPLRKRSCFYKLFASAGSGCLTGATSIGGSVARPQGMSAYDELLRIALALGIPEAEAKEEVSELLRARRVV